MLPTRQGSIRLFQFAGIQVFLHWSWFLVAAYEISVRRGGYSTPLWNALEYLALFVIVTMHEFGHALACRSVGGRADQIVLWPLGGVAYVAPPPRPGALLWSIAAGPLVNVVLLPILTVLVVSLNHTIGFTPSMPDPNKWLFWVWAINLTLLVFNLLPIYPLDGGQILQALLWFLVGRARSLMIVACLGFAGVVALAGLAVWWKSVWTGLIAAFVAIQCVNGFKKAKAMMQFAKMPRRQGFACPSCHAAPPLGNLWVCGKCRMAFDTFETQGVCPKCGTQFAATRCLDCGAVNPISAWAMPPAIPITPSSGS